MSVAKLIRAYLFGKVARFEPYGVGSISPITRTYNALSLLGVYSHFVYSHFVYSHFVYSFTLPGKDTVSFGTRPHLKSVSLLVRAEDPSFTTILYCTQVYVHIMTSDVVASLIITAKLTHFTLTVQWHSSSNCPSALSCYY